MCRDGWRANCQGCGRPLTCRDDYPICEDPCNYGFEGEVDDDEQTP